MRAQAIAKQIDQLELTRARLASEAEEAGNRLADVRKRALASKATTAEVSIAQGDHNARTALLGEADAQLEDLRTQLQEAQETELRANNSRRVGELTEQRKALAVSYSARLARLDDYLSTEIAALVAEREQDAQLANEMRELGGAAESTLAARQWSDSGLKHTEHIAQLIWESRREEERQRIKANLRSDRKAPAVPLAAA